MTVELLARVQSRLSAFAERGVRRLALEVQGEQVSFTLRDTRVQAVCTCGSESCEHQTIAAHFFAEQSEPIAVMSPPVKHRSSLRPPAPHHADAQQLADALEELCLATARAGVSVQDSPSIRAALDQLGNASRQPPSLALARFIGRFQNALTLGEIGEVARLLAGAHAWAAELQQASSSPEAVARTRAWLGTSEGDTPGSLTDVTLIEIGREWLNGLTRSSLERRYLIDLADGQLYSEERRRGDQDISVGPCPRVVQVSFAALETAVLPQRTRLLQYAITLEPTNSQWQRLAELGESDVTALRTRFAREVSACPALAEPVALFAPAQLAALTTGSLRDSGGAKLELWDDSGAQLAEVVRTLASEGEPVWLLGRLKLLEQGLVLRPISALLRSGDAYRLRRIT